MKRLNLKAESKQERMELSNYFLFLCAEDR